MKNLYYLLVISLLVFSSCKKDNEVNEDPLITKSVVNGYVQKGPFLNGTSIVVSELDSSYSATGKVFLTQIADNSGLFQINNVSLISPYVLLKAEGYYFNEVTGINSTAPITLYALTDITDKTSVNVNILSHLEKDRMEYLIANGYSFAVAKKQSEQEILGIFSIVKEDIIDSDMLNISQPGDDNAILLAISVIVQGYRSDADLSELLANISTDIRQDGVLNSSSLGSMLINDAKWLSLSQIRTSIESRYDNLGITATIPDFEKYVNQFIDSTNYLFTNNIEYPENGAYGNNVLYGDDTLYSSSNIYSLAANLPNGVNLKIIIKNGIWYINEFINWTVSTYDYGSQQQIFTSTESGENCDLKIHFESGEHIIEYYENNSATPTRTKTIIVN